jgi:hypothetical protein
MVVFEVFGDSNIAKSWKAVASEQDRLKGSVLRQTTTQLSLRDNLRTVAQSTKYILVAALTNPISRIKFEGAQMLEQAVVEKFDEIYDYFVQTINSCPELKVRYLLFSLLSPFIYVLRHLALFLFTFVLFNLQVFVAPPLFRCQPYWYQNNFVSVTSGFTTSFNRCSDRIILLPPFDCSPNSYNVDGIHFTPGEGERCGFTIF